MCECAREYRLYVYIDTTDLINMDTHYITKKELEESVNEMMPKATVSQYKWIYCYLKDLDDWPIVTDEAKTSKDLMGHGIE